MRMVRFVFVALLALLPLQFTASQALASDKCLVLNSGQYLQASTRLIPLTSDFTIEFNFYLNKELVLWFLNHLATGNRDTQFS